MIPNLNDLPPIPEEEHPLKKLVRPVLAAAFLMLAAAGIIWLFTSGITKLADEEINTIGGLRAVAGDLWNTGSAPEIRLQDPDLVTELARLRKRVGLTPSITVVAAENRPGHPAASHELIYLLKERQVLSVRVHLDVSEGRVDILSYRTGPEYMDQETPP